MGLLVGLKNGGNFMGCKAATVAVKAVQVPVKDSRPSSGEIKRPRKLMMDKIQHTHIHTFMHTHILLLSRTNKASWKRPCSVTHYSGDVGRKKKKRESNRSMKKTAP
jgi:hypothetical protein